MGNTIEVKVAGGTLRAWASEDVGYPGISIEFISDFPVDIETVSYPKIIMEKPEENNGLSSEGLRALLWTDPTTEDYTEEIIFKEPKSALEEKLPVPAFSGRLAKIAAKAKKDREEQQKKEREKKQALDDAMDAVQKLAPRINMLLELANACKKEGIQFPTNTKKYGYGEYDGRRGYNFFADGIEHHVGFMGHNGDKEIEYIGIYNGGYNGPYDFYVNRFGWCGQIASGTNPNTGLDIADKIEHFQKFLAEFDAFEAAFNNWIDSFEK